MACLLLWREKVVYMENIPFNLQMCYVCHKGRGYASIYHKVGV